MSEMGRIPKYNETGGRDHWPYTSAMLLGAGVQGDQQFGAYSDMFSAYSDMFSGIGVDHASGALVPGKLGIDSADFGATVLALAGVDHRSHLPTAEVLSGLLQA
jgi:hypothetical protein